MRDDGIVHVKFLPNTNITVDFQYVLDKIYKRITNGNKAYFIFEGGEFVSVTKDARENAILMEADAMTLASAIIVDNLGHRILADFYYAVNKPKLPYKVFKSIDSAIIWLKELEAIG